MILDQLESICNEKKDIYEISDDRLDYLRSDPDCPRGFHPGFIAEFFDKEWSRYFRTMVI